MPRELIDTGADKRYVRRDKDGTSRSLMTSDGAPQPISANKRKRSRRRAKVTAATDD